MEYDFKHIEQKWRKEWKKRGTYKVQEESSKEKYYVLDMFPYPSGAGLHVGHPLGYIASDIVARYKRLKGFNVLHPMGYDAFGLPAEQYAIQTGQHPATTTEENIARYREQLDQLGFCFDWDREVRTADPNYYKWTQWIFLKLFNSWYDPDQDKARPIEELIGSFDQEDWAAKSEQKKEEALQEHRLAFISEAVVNWCPALGTVLANDEVKDGVSERGGYPVEQKKMKQWSLRITAYAERLLTGLNEIDWSDALKEMQRNWIGRSEGASIKFKVDGSGEEIEVFSTRPDTIFGATFMVLAPEHELVDQITTDDQKEEIAAYVKKAGARSERERLSDVKNVSGAFTGAYALHPFNGKKLPIYIADYVLASYGTGAVMAVPSGDQRDWDFATHFGLDIIPVIEGQDVSKGAEDKKEGKMINSDLLNGMEVKDAIATMVAKIEENGLGEGKVNYKLRDAVFGRQRYWGEPIPIYFENGVPKAMAEKDLPLELPEVDEYKPTEDGEPPLARASDWTYNGHPLEATTMPGWAGSSWYYLRYMDPNNEQEFVSEERLKHWGQIDLYIGGSEHATGHLLYFRFWTKVLFDLGYLPFDEPAKKLINQGMIQGVSARIWRVEVGSSVEEAKTPQVFISDDLMEKWNKGADLKEHNVIASELNQILEKEVDSRPELGSDLQLTLSNHPSIGSLVLMPIDSLVRDSNGLISNNETRVNITELRKWHPTLKNAIFLKKDEFNARREHDKMSKSKYNVVSPDSIIEDHGADTLRLYEMFLGPVEQHKPWDTKGIEGTHRFLRKLWRLFHNAENEFEVSDAEPKPEAQKALHHAIKKIQDDIDRYSFNTVVSELMICVNKLSELKCKERSVLEPLVILLLPYAPHMAEELWEALGHDTSVCDARFPEFDAQFLVEDSVKYPVSFNGKMRFTVELSAELSKEEVEKEVMAMDETAKYLNGGTPKKVIVVPKRIVNIVV